jgi:hypothetical protein
MAYVEIMFYVAKEGKLSDRAIAWWTGGDFSHVELRFYTPDGELCFSASPREGRVRFKEIVPKPGHWVTYRLALSQMQVGNLYNFCCQQKGKKYDWLGIFGFVIGKKCENPKRWYCSEVCGRALTYAGWAHLPRKISPVQLEKIVSDSTVASRMADFPQTSEDS